MKPDKAFARMQVGKPQLNPWWLRGWLGSMRAAAWTWRRMNVNKNVICLTGSAGKTTAKECLTTILASDAPTIGTLDTRNDLSHGVPSTLLRIRPLTRYAVIETGAHRAGFIHKSGRLCKPDVVVITTIENSHPEEYDSLECIAAEKCLLLDSLKPGGTAVVNGDDEVLMNAVSSYSCRNLTFGTGPGNALRASNISSRWPDRLSFKAHYGGRSCQVQTMLVGSQYLYSALSAIGGALACGLELDQACAALQAVQPYRARTQPVPLTCGATMIRDDFGGNWFQYEAALRVLGEARAERRVAVLGPVSEAGVPGRENWRKLARKAVGCSDLLVFVGVNARAARAEAKRAELEPGQVFSFEKLRQAAEYLRSELRAGDLVLLKGGRTTEHLARLYFAQTGTIQCWLRHCKKPILCDFCSELGHQADPVIGK